MTPPVSHSSSAPSDVPRGALDLPTLAARSLAPVHGRALAQRLDEKGWMDSEWKAAGQNRRELIFRTT